MVLMYVSRCEMYKHIGVGKVYEKLSNCMTLCKLFLACILFQSIPSISFHCLHLIILSVGRSPSPDYTIIYFSNLVIECSGCVPVAIPLLPAAPKLCCGNILNTGIWAERASVGWFESSQVSSASSTSSLERRRLWFLRELDPHRADHVRGTLRTTQSNLAGGG